MATKDYMLGRKKYQRPQGMLWANNPGELVNGVYVPSGFESNADFDPLLDADEANQFIILSDDNRDAFDVKPIRIERRERMINGRMRSYHIADKLTISTSWSLLPSRSFSASPLFDLNGKPLNLVTSVNHDNNNATPNKTVVPSGSPYYKDQQFTTDGGAGGAEILKWYEDHRGPFWVYLAYDKYTNFETNKYEKLDIYNQVVEMYIADFSYSVQKRGGSNHDLWNISVTLEEV